MPYSAVLLVCTQLCHFCLCQMLRYWAWNNGSIDTKCSVPARTIELFPLSLGPAVGRAGLDSRKEDDAWCVCCSLCTAAVRRVTSSDGLDFRRLDGKAQGPIYRILLHYTNK